MTRDLIAFLFLGGEEQDDCHSFSPSPPSPLSRAAARFLSRLDKQGGRGCCWIMSRRFFGFTGRQNNIQPCLPHRNSREAVSPPASMSLQVSDWPTVIKALDPPFFHNVTSPAQCNCCLFRQNFATCFTSHILPLMETLVKLCFVPSDLHSLFRQGTF